MLLLYWSYYCINNKHNGIPKQCGWVGVFVEGHKKLSIFDLGVVEYGSTFSCKEQVWPRWLNAYSDIMVQELVE